LISEPEDIEPTQIRLEAFRSQLALLSIPTPTAKQSKTVAARFEGVRADFRITKELISEAEAKLTEATNRLVPANPLELLRKQADRNERAYKAALRSRRDNVQNSLQLQLAKMVNLEKDRAEKFVAEIGGVLQRFQSEQITFTNASALLTTAREVSEFESDLIFQPFQRILEILEENIDLNHLINFGLDEENELRGELERITGLAQLGVAVEISGHELQDYEHLIAAAFSKLPPDIRALKPVKDIEFGVEGLTDQMRFLSPMRIAGQKVRARISGSEIMSYLKDFFKLQLASHRIDLAATDTFEKFWIMEFASRLFPAFINLVNNAIYWVSNSTEANRQIIVDVVGLEVVISDNGPGVNEDDRAELFKLFFTRKNYGGRGVGLYLTRSNLMSGGHKIRYVSDVSGMPLNGANFAINFQGAEFG
jgi:signal transduction histidine kinase